MSQKQIQVKFVGHDINKGVVMYKIQLYDPRDSVQWVLQYRYSQMRDISNQLEEQFPDNLPEFPPKKWFGNTDEKFINQREKALENYFSTTLKSVSLDKAKCLKDFLFKGKQAGGPVMGDETSGKSEINPVVIQPNPQGPGFNQQGGEKPSQQNLEIQKKNNSQEEWKNKMETLVSKVPFVNFVVFAGHDHDNQDFKRNIYNQIAFETKSVLLQVLTVPHSTSDNSGAALSAPPASILFESKLDSFAEKIQKALSSPFSNIRCDISQKPNFA